MSEEAKTPVSTPTTPQEQDKNEGKDGYITNKDMEEANRMSFIRYLFKTDLRAEMQDLKEDMKVEVSQQMHTLMVGHKLEMCEMIDKNMRRERERRVFAFLIKLLISFIVFGLVYFGIFTDNLSEILKILINA